MRLSKSNIILTVTSLELDEAQNERYMVKLKRLMINTVMRYASLLSEQRDENSYRED